MHLLYSLDLISELMFGKSFGCIKRGDDVVTTQRADGKVHTECPFRSLYTMGS